MTDMIKRIFEQFMQERFSHLNSDESYYKQWEKRFQKGLEWLSSDYANRATLKRIASDLYPDDKDKYFIRE